MKVTMRSTVALTLAALAFGAATILNELHVTEVDTFTVDCTDTDKAPLPTLTVKTFFSTHVHQSIEFTLPSEIALPTEISWPTKAITYSYSEEQSVASTTCTSVEEQPFTSATSTSVEEQPTVSPAASTASTSTGEEPITSSTVPPFTSTKLQSTFVMVPVSTESVPAIVSTSSTRSDTEPAPTTTAEQTSATEAIVPPVVSAKTPLINPIHPSFTPSDTQTTTSITLTTTETLPGTSIPPVKEGVSQVSSETSEAIIQIPPVTQGVPPVVSNSVASSIFSTTTKTLTRSHTTVVTVIESPTQVSASAEDCLSTVYVTFYSPPSPPAPVATAPSAPPAIVHNTTIVVATGVPHPVYNTTTANTTTAQTSPPIHGAAPSISATPGLLLAFCGLICYLI